MTKLPTGRHTSTIKATGRSKQKYLRNKSLRSRANTYIRKLRQAADEGNLDEANNLLSTTVKYIDKAASKGAIHKKKTFHIEEIKNVAGAHKKDDIFGYIDSLVEGDGQKAMLLLDNILKYGTEPIKIIGMLKWKLQQMITIRALMEKGMNEKMIIDTLKLHYYFYRGVCKKIGRFKLKGLIKSYEQLYRTDIQLKSLSAVDKNFLLEKFSITFLSG